MQRCSDPMHGRIIEHKMQPAVAAQEIRIHGVAVPIGRYSGDQRRRGFRAFAWGVGVDRVACLKYGISDIRLIYEGDGRFLSQFK